MRGILTTEIQNKANSFLKREISQKELRLYPYIDYSIKNGCQGWSYSKMDEEEILKLKFSDKERYRMNKENENAIFDAADVICLNCVEDTLNDNSVCENCPVRKLCNSLSSK